MKTTPGNHVECITDSYCVLLPRILEIYEKHEIWKIHFQEKGEKNKNAQKDKWEKDKTLEAKVTWSWKVPFLFYLM